MLPISENKTFLQLYEKLGFAVLPAAYGKKYPRVEWKQYQEKGPSKEQVEEWFKEGESNVAILCGPPSADLAVIDFDDMEVYPKFFDTTKIEKKTIVVKTGSGKRHVYLRTEKPVASFKIPKLSIEIRSGGNIVVAPPSLHPSGNHYEFVNPEVKDVMLVSDLEATVWSKAEKLGVPKPHDFFFEHSEKNQGQPYTGETPPCIINMLRGVEEGVRNEAGIRLASYWLHFKQNIVPDQLLKQLEQWNQLNNPPLPIEELKNIIESAGNLDRSYGCRVNQAWCDVENCPLKYRQLLDAKAEKELEKTIDEYEGKETYPILFKTISYTVKRDNIAKQHDLLHVSSMYAAPINELKEAPSSTGKTYPLMQIIRLFPPEDIMVLGGLSPTALAHDYGIPVDPSGEDLRPKIQELRDKIEKLKDDLTEAKRGEKEKLKRGIEKVQRELYDLTKDNVRLIDLENKAIIFVDNPNPRTWAKLRPIMSHDKWETTYKFTDRTSKSGPLRQVTAILRGWPVFIAFKAEETPNKGWTREIWQQILTRGTTVPVEMSSTKYKEAIKLTGVKKGLPQPVLNQELKLAEFKRCQRIIQAIRHHILTIKQKVRGQTGKEGLPNIFWIPYYDVVTEKFPHRKGVHMREADRFLSIIQNHTVLNVFNRPTLEIGGVSYLICTLLDLWKAVELYFSDEARKTIFGKIPTNQIKFFEEIILPLSKLNPEGILASDMQKAYKEVFDEPISTNTINYHYLQPLENMDLINREDDPDDRRKKLTKPLREKVFVEEGLTYSLLEEGGFFTKEKLREALNKLEQLIVREPPYNIVKLKDYDGTTINVETLYEKYFDKKVLIAEGSSNNYSSEQDNKPKTEKEGETTPVLRKEAKQGKPTTCPYCNKLPNGDEVWEQYRDRFNKQVATLRLENSRKSSEREEGSSKQIEEYHSRISETRKPFGSVSQTPLVKEPLKGTPLTCTHCLNHRTDTCIQEHPNLILPTAEFARTCEAFKSRTLTVAEGKPIVRHEFKRGTEQDFVKLSMKILGLSEYAAKGWFQQLVETDELGYDNDGLYGWMEKPQRVKGLSRGAGLETLGDER